MHSPPLFSRGLAGVVPSHLHGRGLARRGHTAHFASAFAVVGVSLAPPLARLYI